MRMHHPAVEYYLRVAKMGFGSAIGIGGKSKSGILVFSIGFFLNVACVYAKAGWNGVANQGWEWAIGTGVMTAAAWAVLLFLCICAAPFQIHITDQNELALIKAAHAAGSDATTPLMSIIVSNDHDRDAQRLKAARRTLNEIACETTTFYSKSPQLVQGERIQATWVEATRAGLRALVRKDICEDYEKILAREDPRAEARVFLETLLESLTLDDLR